MTDDEIDKIAGQYGNFVDLRTFARDIIAADRAKREPMQNDEVDALLRGHVPRPRRNGQ